MPKILVSVRLNEKTVELLNRIAKEKNVGLSVLIRQYVESMLMLETTSISKIIHIPIEEYIFLIKKLNKNELDAYIDEILRIFSLRYLWKYSISIEHAVLADILKEFLEIMKISGRIHDYEIKTHGAKIFAKLILSNKALSKIIESLLRRLLGNKLVDLKVSENVLILIARGDKK